MEGGPEEQFLDNHRANGDDDQDLQEHRGHRHVSPVIGHQSQQATGDDDCAHGGERDSAQAKATCQIG